MVYYRRDPNIDQRGTGIIFSGYAYEELEFLQKMALFSPKLFYGDPAREFYYSTGLPRFWFLWQKCLEQLGLSKRRE